MYRWMIIGLLFSGCFTFFFSACAKNAVSDRDTKLNQQRSNAEKRRQELLLVVGDYTGVLTQPTGISQNIVLKLEIKDVPTTVEGQIDQVLVPILSGYIRFVFGNPSATSEYISFSIEKVEFDPKTNGLTLLVTNSGYKDLNLGLRFNEGELSGKWVAAGVGTAGTALLRRGLDAPLSPTIRGTYRGKLTNTNPQSSLPERVQVSFVTAQDPSQPDIIRVTGNMRLYFGEFESLEYQEIVFATVNYNVFTGILVAKSSKDYYLTIKAEVGLNQIKGTLAEDALGEVGILEVRKQ